MNPLPITGSHRFITSFTSRRGLLATASAGLLAMHQLAPRETSAAKKKCYRKHKKGKNT